MQIHDNIRHKYTFSLKFINKEKQRKHDIKDNNEPLIEAWLSTSSVNEEVNKLIILFIISLVLLIVNWSSSANGSTIVAVSVVSSMK